MCEVSKLRWARMIEGLCPLMRRTIGWNDDDDNDDDKGERKMIYETFLPTNIFSGQILFLVLSPKTDLHLQSPCTIINHRTWLKLLSTSIDKEFIKALGPNYWTIWIISLEVVAAKNNDLKMLTFILVFSIVGLIGSGAQIIQDGQCNPDITLFNNFNIDNVSLISCKDAWKVI